jgi:hypothetical protein
MVEACFGCHDDQGSPWGLRRDPVVVADKVLEAHALALLQRKVLEPQFHLRFLTLAVQDDAGGLCGPRGLGEPFCCGLADRSDDGCFLVSDRQNRLDGKQKVGFERVRRALSETVDVDASEAVMDVDVDGQLVSKSHGGD